MKDLLQLLQGGDLRSLEHSSEAIALISSPKAFDELFALLLHSDRVVVMRAADVAEKVTISKPEYLAPHKKQIIKLMSTAVDKELKWHLALMAPRMKYTERELGLVWDTLTRWALDTKESRIVRVHSLQGLHDLLAQEPGLQQDLLLTLGQAEAENIPSINARAKRLKKRKGQ